MYSHYLSLLFPANTHKKTWRTEKTRNKNPHKTRELPHTPVGKKFLPVQATSTQLAGQTHRISDVRTLLAQTGAGAADLVSAGGCACCERV